MLTLKPCPLPGEYCCQIHPAGCETQFSRSVNALITRRMNGFSNVLEIVRLDRDFRDDFWLESCAVRGANGFGQIGQGGAFAADSGGDTHLRINSFVRIESPGPSARAFRFQFYFRTFRCREVSLAADFLRRVN